MDFGAYDYFFIVDFVQQPGIRYPLAMMDELFDGYTGLYFQVL